MKRLKDIFRMTFLMIIIFQLTGCTVIIFSYFRNFSDSPVEITIKSIASEINCQKIETGVLVYKDEILNINRKTYKHLNDSLEYLKIDTSTIKLIIPAHSTVMLTPALKLRWYDTDFYRIILRQNENLDTLEFNVGSYNMNDIKDPDSNFKRTGILTKNIFYYDYKGRK